MNLLPAHAVTSPPTPTSHFPNSPADVFEETERLCAQREAVRSGTDSALSMGRRDATGGGGGDTAFPVGRQRQTHASVSPWGRLVLSDGGVSVGNLVRQCRGIIMSLGLFLTPRVKEWQSSEAHHKDNTSPQRGMAHAPKTKQSWKTIYQLPALGNIN